MTDREFVEYALDKPAYPAVRSIVFHPGRPYCRLVVLDYARYGDEFPCDSLYIDRKPENVGKLLVMLSDASAALLDNPS